MAIPSPMVWLDAGSLLPLEDGRQTLSNADTHGDERVPSVPPCQLSQCRSGKTRSGRGDRMADRDRAAVHVGTVLGEAYLAQARDDLRRERFVELDDVVLV